MLVFIKTKKKNKTKKQKTIWYLQKQKLISKLNFLNKNKNLIINLN